MVQCSIETTEQGKGRSEAQGTPDVEKEHETEHGTKPCTLSKVFNEIEYTILLLVCDEGLIIGQLSASLGRLFPI